jgi:MSHA biogenesis protein MshK
MINYLRTGYITRNIGGALLRPLKGIAVFCVLSAAVVSLHAENLPDPTRPPADVITASGARYGRGVMSSSGLRSIIISDTRRAAIIDGKTVELGGQLGNARLVEVNPGSVVLQRGRNRQVLTLFPGVRISHQEIADTGSSKMESSSNEMQVEQPSPADNSASPNHELKPAAEEKILSVHPKEEK